MYVLRVLFSGQYNPPPYTGQQMVAGAGPQMAAGAAAPDSSQAPPVEQKSGLPPAY